MVMLDSACREVPVPALARWLLGLGIAATLAASVAYGLGHGLVGAAVAAWPAVALVGSYELLMTIIRATRQADGRKPREEHVSDRLTPGLQHKAAKGELKIPLPVGLNCDEDGQLAVS